MPLTRRLLLRSTFASIVPLPALAAPAAGEDGFRVLEARPGTLRLRPLPASETAVWTYDGSVPGPLLRAKLGEEIKVRLVNRLAQPTSLCWHGMRIANAMDGVAGLTQPPVAPGASFDYRFTPPDAGLYWYHPHVTPYSGEQIGRGLYGAIIVDEREPPPVDRDMLVVIDDWRLDDTAQIKADFGNLADAMRAGRIGPLLTVNSKPVPASETLAPGSRLRLRIVSAVNARIMLVTFVGVRPLIMAIDGQPCEAFEPVRRTIPIGPGARFDVMFDLPETAGAEAAVVLLGDHAPDQSLVAFKTAGVRRPARPAIASLAPNPLLPAEIHLEKSLKVNIVLDGGSKARDAPNARPADLRRLWTMNGVASDGNAPRPLFSVRRGAPVTIGFVNKTAYVQQMHVHGHHVRLLHDLDDGWEPYWRDCVLVGEGRTKHIAFVADNPGKWAIECLMAERQASGMAAWFEVTG